VKQKKYWMTICCVFILGSCVPLKNNKKLLGPLQTKKKLGKFS